MIDRAARDCLAEAIRHLVSGAITNLAFDDTPMNVAERSADRGVRTIAERVWTLYDDFDVQRLEITDGERRDLARCILFLHSDVEFDWPESPSLLARMLYLFTGRRPLREDLRKAYRYWPFRSKQDYELALKYPRLLGGAA